MKPPLTIDRAAQLLEAVSSGRIPPQGPAFNDIAASFKDSAADNLPDCLVLVDLLTELALAGRPGPASEAVFTLYREIIEYYSDDFSPASTRIGNSVLARIITRTRHNQAGRQLDALLNSQRLRTESDLLSRWRRLVSKGPISPERRWETDRIIIPSRVTTGADIAITSILVQRLLPAFPKADITLIGPAHLAEIFHGIDRVTPCPFEIKRGGGLADRILFASRLFELVAKLAAGARQPLLFDPDSRLSQLGLLPLLAEDRTFHFNSRSADFIKEGCSLSEAANLWLNRLLGEDRLLPPRLNLSEEDQIFSESFKNSVTSRGCRRLIMINLGVGGDERKRLSQEFEFRLLSELLKAAGTIILLDKGSGSEEKARVDRLLNRLGSRAVPTGEISAAGKLAGAAGEMNHGVIGLESSLGRLAALTREAELFVGYDSCPQHLASAVGTRGITLFAGYPNRRFISRWSPWSGQTTTHILPIDSAGPANKTDLDSVISLVIKLADHP